MALLEIHWHPSPRELRQFGVLLAVFLTVVAGWLISRQFGGFPIAATCIGALVAGIVSYLKPLWLRPVYVGWMCAAFPIGWIVSHLLLATIYYGLLTPIGVLLRVFGYDALERRFDPRTDSYWTPRPPPRDRQQYFRQF